MSLHTLTVAAFVLLFLTFMVALVAVVVCTEPGALERYLNGLAYHRTPANRGGARHARRGEATETTTLPALAPAEATS